MNKKISVNVNGGIGFFGLLAIVLIALKLTGQITLGWLWIIAIPFTPLIIIFGIWLAIVLLAVIWSLVVAVLDQVEKWKS